jgi:predicted TIM-barrel fold metal-dependent hydrolase
MNLSRRDFHSGALGMAGASVLSRRGWAQDAPATLAAVDSHAHVFRRDWPLADARRYAPDYDATPEDYLKVLDANGIAQGVLVQPSFYGTDNRYLLEALARAPTRLRGIAVVAPGIDREALQALDAAGIVGIRLNLIGLPDPNFGTAPWADLLRRLADRDWQVEVQAEARRWPALLDPLLGAGVKVVADHFGKPDPALGIDDPGFRHLLERGRTGRVWVKLSGSYRNGAGEVGDRITRAAVPLLKDRLGLERLVWGSDWPHTQFERVAGYAQVRAQLDAWLPDPAERRIVLSDTPRALFRLPAIRVPT